MWTNIAQNRATALLVEATEKFLVKGSNLSKLMRQLQYLGLHDLIQLVNVYYVYSGHTKRFYLGLELVNNTLA